MDQWLTHRSRYLRIILEMESQSSTPKCSICNKHCDIKCPDCTGAPLFCTGCCVVAHRHSPFHRPLQWTSTHYTPVSLHSLGFVLFIGHEGLPCPETVEVSIYLSIFTGSYLHSGHQGHRGQGQETRPIWALFPCGSAFHC